MSPVPTTMTEMVIQSTVYVVRNLPRIFRDEPQPASYDMLFVDHEDGCAKHDDVWGG